MEESQSSSSSAFLLLLWFCIEMATLGLSKVFILDKYFTELQKFWETEKKLQGVQTGRQAGLWRGWWLCECICVCVCVCVSLALWTGMREVRVSVSLKGSRLACLVCFLRWWVDSSNNAGCIVVGNWLGRF